MIPAVRLAGARPPKWRRGFVGQDIVAKTEEEITIAFADGGEAFHLAAFFKIQIVTPRLPRTNDRQRIREVRHSTVRRLLSSYVQLS